MKISMQLLRVGVLAATVSTTAFAAEWATKDEAVAMVKNAVAFIKEQGPEKAYSEISNKSGRFVDRMATKDDLKSSTKNDVRRIGTGIVALELKSVREQLKQIEHHLDTLDKQYANLKG